MTDHNADASKMVEPCAWCGFQPDYRTFDETIPSCACHPRHIDDQFFDILEWNAAQKRVLEIRRQDFEAGRKITPNIRNGDMALNMLAYRSFDEYLASEKK